jgi:hypothetical protein
MNKKVAHIFAAQIFMPSSPSTPSAHCIYIYIILSAELPFRCGALNLIKSNINTPFMGRAAPCRNTNAALEQLASTWISHTHTLPAFHAEKALHDFFSLWQLSEWALGWARKAWSWHIDIKAKGICAKNRRLSDVIAHSAFASQVQTPCACVRCLITFSSTARSQFV